MTKFFYGTGRRKTSASRVFLKEGSGNIQVNSKPLNQYFKTLQLQNTALSPLKLTNTEKQVDLTMTVKGGGITGQSESIRHGLSRALIRWSADYRPVLKKAGFLTRDSRSVERKKYGHHKARKSTQFSKR